MKKICYFLDASENFLSLIRFANDLYALYNYSAIRVSFDLPRRVLYNRPNANTLARFRKTMKTCESVKRNVELFL